MPLEIYSNQFENEVISSRTPVLVDFYAVWCQPCKMLSPIVEGLGSKYGEKLKVVKLNVDENPDIANRYNISSIPTLILFKDGSPVKSLVGFRPQPFIEKEISSYLS